MKIKHKISVGYGLAISIALGGSCLGNEIGDYYLWKAWQRQKMTRHEVDLLHQLQTSILLVRAKQQALYTSTQQPKALLAHAEDIQTESLDLVSTWQSLETLVEERQSNHTLDVNRRLTQVHRFLSDYSGNVEAYLSELAETTAQIDVTTSDNNVRELLLTLKRSPLTTNLNQITVELRQLLQLTATEYQNSQQEYDQADALRFQISVVSFCLSVLLALLLTILTSQAISDPLQTVNAVAQKVTRESDFDQTVPVLSEDEIGQLAISLNQLIDQVQFLLTEREISNVQLNAQNQQLQDTLVTLKHTQSQIVQSEKMSGLGQMVAGVAHEINNPINFIIGNLYYTEEYFLNLFSLIQLYQKNNPQASPEIEEALDNIDLDFFEEDFKKMLNSMQNGSRRIQDIVKSLRTFSHLDEVGIKTIDIHANLDSTLMLLANRLQAPLNRANIQIIKRYSQLPTVECYAGPLNQAFLNILTNAIDALDCRGKSFQSLEHVPLSEKTLQNTDSPGMQNNGLTQRCGGSTITIQTQQIREGWVEIAITDDGPGIPENLQSKIFDPFFTTKPVGQGSGLGLATSYQIVVDQHNGQLLCNSSPNQGTTFTIHLPAHQRSPSCD